MRIDLGAGSSELNTIPDISGLLNGGSRKAGPVAQAPSGGPHVDRMPPGILRGLESLRGILEHAASGWGDPQAASRLEEQIRRRLRPRDVLDGNAVSYTHLDVYKRQVPKVIKK